MPQVLIACSASVAAIKIPIIISELIRNDISVTLVVTEASKHFLDIEQIRKDFNIDIYTDQNEWDAWKIRGDPVLHIELSKKADLLVLAPLSANTMAKVSTGICDNLLTCIVRAWNVSKPVLFCPSMNTQMWNHPVTKEQVNKLVLWGYILIPPIVKTLMCGDHGIGAMAEVETIVNQILEKLNLIGPEKCVIIRLSGPIKKHWAQTKLLQLDELLSDGEMKEQHRKAMIEWSENVRSNDHSYFCRMAIDMYDKNRSKEIWIISDARRKTDLTWFKSNFDNLRLIRITADESTRKERGWSFIQGIDDAPSECDLDDYVGWDLVVQNNKHDSCQGLIDEIVNQALSAQ